MTRHLFHLSRILALILLLGLALQPLLAQEATPIPLGPTLKSVLSRGELSCGVDMNLPGFGFLDPNIGGDPAGFEVELCRALAAAIFGDPAAVIFPPMTNMQASFAALNAGDLDIVMNLVPVSLTTDTQGFEFGPPIFYSGQGVIVRADFGGQNWTDLNGKTVCVVSDSVADHELETYAATQNITISKLQQPTRTDAWQALRAGQCEAMSDDRVQLAILRRQATDPASFILWQGIDQIYTREPYAPLLRYSDDQWNNIVRWTILGLVEAEQHGVSSETILQLQRQDVDKLSAAETAAGASEDDKYVARVGGEVARLIDSKLGIGAQLGIASNFMAVTITAVGNYGEIYNRNFGPDKVMPLQRGLNALQKDGGLLYSPDWR
ncbi:MAG: transporter substrate-binding domain-containing protein [Anaerolineae bacterium]